MKEEIKKLDLSHEFYTPEKCYITELSNTPADPDSSIARARVAPGTATAWHCLHGITERYYIIQGRGMMEVGKQPAQEVTAGDVVLIPPLCRQRITNIGHNDLIFLAICMPRFIQEAYEEIEN